MATTATFTSLGSGRLPGVRGGGTVPGPGLKVRIGRFAVAGTSDYPDDGWTAADLATIFGLKTVVTIIPCSPLRTATGETGYTLGWDSTSATMRAYGNLGLDGNALTVGTSGSSGEMATNSSALASTFADVIVIGF